MESQKLEEVKDYYGKEVKQTTDLKTQACVTGATRVPKSVAKAIGEVHDEIVIRYYGCGSPFPEALEGQTVLDLGCGTGRDVYASAKLVGSTGKVIGVDMTDEQLEVARKYQDWHTEKFGYDNTEFLKGQIEGLVDAGVPENSVDVIISNCVVNLAPDKGQVFDEINRVLKHGGEVYFSDVYADRDIPQELQDDKVLWGECISGAMGFETFRTLMKAKGFKEVRRVSSRQISFDDNPKIKEQLGDIRFASMTIRLYKDDSLEDSNQDYGETATYNGGIPDKEKGVVFDEFYYFPVNEPVSVCHNTAQILRNSRFAQYFTVSEQGELKGAHPIQTGKYDFIHEESSKPQGEMVAMPNSCCSAEEKAGGCCPGEEKKEGCCPPKDCCPDNPDKSKCKPKEGCCPPKEDCCPDNPDKSKCPPKEGCCGPKKCC